ncbi:hypothetical protein SAMN02745164_01196 [Marinitoga hydrogenitolerans DSM 16785]|uniref:Mut7-C RNAse domain-containing protein n=1 Tax=Marinitoga hydrogenitolerans (strain DSM 16785 / JCM 12826 / AT1271) TaxID=1122195 RepID=A0A1M4WJH6_MARH1|nr:Mut7-C RNAse domain-containing protein [Marinitoga hydrogenitolerans]SHE81355.1 hypothetical protein SAMN02745164_01196 [Marinitoga hydrogenitolerans DSM 16785]
MNEFCFILDATLGKLAQKIRILGFNAMYFNNITYEELEIFISKNSNCIVLTRNRKFYEKLKEKYDILFIKSDLWRAQLRFVVKKLNLKLINLKIFSRCIICNSQLVKVKKENYKDIIPDHVYRTCDEYSYCEKCQKIYWHGTHVEHVLCDLREIFKE